MGITRIGDSENWMEHLAPPQPLVKQINCQNYYGRAVPTPDNDGSYIQLPASIDSASTLERFNAADAQVWAVAGTDIDASCNYWTGCFWLDTTDSAIWVWCYAVGTTPDTYYLAKVALSDGAITNIGSCQPGDGLFAYSFNQYYVYRASMGSGDLTIRDGDYRISLSTSTGAITVAAAQVSQNGVAIHSSSGYETADGDIFVSDFATTSSSSSLISGSIARGGMRRMVALPTQSPGGNAAPYVFLWDGYVASATTGSGVVRNARFFNRGEFDQWLTKIADYYGLPT